MSSSIRNIRKSQFNHFEIFYEYQIPFNEFPKELPTMYIELFLLLFILTSSIVIKAKEVEAKQLEETNNSNEEETKEEDNGNSES